MSIILSMFLFNLGAAGGLQCQWEFRERCPLVPLTLAECKEPFGNPLLVPEWDL